MRIFICQATSFYRTKFPILPKNFLYFLPLCSALFSYTLYSTTATLFCLAQCLIKITQLPFKLIPSKLSPPGPELNSEIPFCRVPATNFDSESNQTTHLKWTKERECVRGCISNARLGTNSKCLPKQNEDN